MLKLTLSLYFLHHYEIVNRLIGKDRVIWGTDWPHPSVLPPTLTNDGDLVDLIPAYTKDPALQRKLLVDNPARLYEFY